MTCYISHFVVTLLSMSHDLSQESLRRTQMTRFYLKELKDPHGTHIALYVGNLPTGLSQRQYEKILLDIIGKGGCCCAWEERGVLLCVGGKGGAEGKSR